MNSLFYMQQLTTWTDMSLYLLLLKNFMLSPSPPPTLSLSVSLNKQTCIICLQHSTASQPATDPSIISFTHTHMIPETSSHSAARTYLFICLPHPLSLSLQVSRKAPSNTQFYLLFAKPIHIHFYSHSLTHPSLHIYLFALSKELFCRKRWRLISGQPGLYVKADSMYNCMLNEFCTDK